MKEDRVAQKVSTLTFKIEEAVQEKPTIMIRVTRHQSLYCRTACVRLSFESWSCICCIRTFVPNSLTNAVFAHAIRNTGSLLNLCDPTYTIGHIQRLRVLVSSSVRQAKWLR